mmetsp:Transcript_30039/g.68574  ORF Transcript_30039/g.68574 Transcript_30039/m.68574 type:complete len:87 (-) Transcript_30039:616-876(-)
MALRGNSLEINSKLLLRSLLVAFAKKSVAKCMEYSDLQAIDTQLAATNPTAPRSATRPGATTANMPPTTACAIPNCVTSFPDVETP